MVKFSPEHPNQAMDRTFAALSDPTRRAIVARMADGDHEDVGLPVTELAEPFLERMSLPAVSKHLRVLERAGLLQQEKHGRVRRCRLQPEPLKEAYEWVARYQRFWSDQLDALASFLENESESESQSSAQSDHGANAESRPKS